MSSGSRLVLVFALLVALVFVALRLYGGRSLSRRGPDSPALVAREIAQSDNTLVGLVGGIRRFRVVEERAESDSTARVEARVVGARDSGRLVVDLRVEDGRWRMREAHVTLSDGRTIPVLGSSRR